MTHARNILRSMAFPAGLNAAAANATTQRKLQDTKAGLHDLDVLRKYYERRMAERAATIPAPPSSPVDLHMWLVHPNGGSCPEGCEAEPDPERAWLYQQGRTK